MFKFIHTADIHLDSPLIGLEQYPGAPVEEIRCATRRALENLVKLAIKEEVDFVLICGDLYDGDWKDFNTVLYFANEISKLCRHNIKVYMVSGNHDAQSRMSKDFSLPDNVISFPTKKPGTEILNLEDCKIAIHGQGFLKQDVSDNLAEDYPDCVDGNFNIGMLHTCASGREGHERYAPCSLDDLKSKGYDYWALGHVHNREVLSKDPWVIFPGNIQGRHINETGEKGCTLVAVDDDNQIVAEHIPLDLLRWTKCEVDATVAKTAEDVVDIIDMSLMEKWEGRDGRILALRFEVSGACKAHGEISADPERWKNEIRQKANDIGGGDIWVEKIKFKTSAPVDIDKMMSRDDAFGGLLRHITNLSFNQEEFSEIIEDLQTFQNKLPYEITNGEDAIDLTNHEKLEEIIDDVKQILIPRLLGMGEES